MWGGMFVFVFLCFVSLNRPWRGGEGEEGGEGEREGGGERREGEGEESCWLGWVRAENESAEGLNYFVPIRMRYRMKNICHLLPLLPHLLPLSLSSLLPFPPSLPSPLSPLSFPISLSSRPTRPIKRE